MDPQCFQFGSGANLDPDPAIYLSSDPDTDLDTDSAIYLSSDPDPDLESQANADPDPVQTVKSQKLNFT